MSLVDTSPSHTLTFRPRPDGESDPGRLAHERLPVVAVVMIAVIMGIPVVVVTVVFMVTLVFMVPVAFMDCPALLVVVTQCPLLRTGEAVQFCSLGENSHTSKGDR